MNETLKSPEDVPYQKSTPIPVDWLRMDRENPRLVSVEPDAPDHQVIAQLYLREELGELLQSIAANGYMDIEPMIVTIEPGNDIFTVLEGNRRLAAIRLFREPELAGEIRSKQNVKIPVPEISEEFAETLNYVSVYRVDSRESARSFIGFKHINGAARWESYAKAKFAADWFRKGGVDLPEIAEKIGDKHDTIKRMVSAIYVLEQAEQKQLFSVENQLSGRFNFSHLYTALSRTNYMNFLGLETAWSRYEPTPNPVPEDHEENLRELMSWMYGSREENQEPLIKSQNPDIKRLGEVLCSAEGLAMLRAGKDLDEAHASTEEAEDKLSASLIRARSTLREAANNLRGYDGNDNSLLDIAGDVHETAEMIYERMKKKNRDARKRDFHEDED